MLQISEEQLLEATKNAKTCIAFEDNDHQKQYFRGVKDTLENLLAKAKEISRNYNSFGWRVIDDALTCDVCIENNKDLTRTINCECGNWEEFPADMPRNKAQTFQVVALDDDNGAVYQCGCGENVVSEIIAKNP